MAEHAPSGYKRLFEVRLLHHYWLDEGAVVFDLIPDQAKRNTRLLDYDRRPMLAIKPTCTTKKILSNYGCLFKETAPGFVVAAPDEVQLPLDTVLSFIITVENEKFHEYTALTLHSQPICELYSELDRTMYRYKGNVPVLSNLTGAVRGAGVDKALYLSQEYPAAAANDPAESLVKSGSSLMQLSGDNPGAATQQLSDHIDEWPVFLHQGDVPAITPPAGLSGTPEKGIRLSDEVTDDVFAFLSLSAQRLDDDAFSFVDAQGKVKATAPIFQVRFKNRSTYRRYLDKITGSETSIESDPLPITYFGNAGTKPKPSDGSVKVEKSGTKITRLISEIYI